MTILIGGVCGTCGALLVIMRCTKGHQRRETISRRLFLPAA